MEEELQQLRDLVLQLRADNERLLQEGAASQAGPSVAASASSVPASNVLPAGASAIVTEKLVVVPRDRRCPMFNGKTGRHISIAEWTEQLQAGMCACRLSAVDQALFMFDHLEGEARTEIKYHTSAE